eukprot:11189831-Lingulodinium_polyedra.AAC.1
MVLLDLPAADKAQYTWRLCTPDDAPPGEGPARCYYLVSDGKNKWLWCRTCGKNDDNHGRLTSSGRRKSI